MVCCVLFAVCDLFFDVCFLLFGGWGCCCCCCCCFCCWWWWLLLLLCFLLFVVGSWLWLVGCRLTVVICWLLGVVVVICFCACLLFVCLPACLFVVCLCRDWFVCLGGCVPSQSLLLPEEAAKGGFWMIAADFPEPLLSPFLPSQIFQFRVVGSRGLSPLL